MKRKRSKVDVAVFARRVIDLLGEAEALVSGLPLDWEQTLAVLRALGSFARAMGATPVADEIYRFVEEIEEEGE